MQCPSCQKKSLKPAQFEYGLPALNCNSCRGSLIDILSYRMWRDKTKNKEKESNKQLSQVKDSKKALCCPKCSKLMVKYNIAGEVDNKIDLCTNCGNFWLDGGEWNLLQALALDKEIPAMFNEPWQKKIREQKAEQAYELKYQQIFASDYAKVSEFKAWLDSHDNNDSILDYLNKV